MKEIVLHVANGNLFLASYFSHFSHETFVRKNIIVKKKSFEEISYKKLKRFLRGFLFDLFVLLRLLVARVELYCTSIKGWWYFHCLFLDFDMLFLLYLLFCYCFCTLFKQKILSNNVNDYIPSAFFISVQILVWK